MNARSQELRPRLIVTADDFGRDAVCTTAIADSLERGRISATSIMANGACFEQACALFREKHLAGKVGVHLALDEGRPLSPLMQPFTDAAGGMCTRRSLSPLGGDLARAIEAELSAQVERVLQAGITPTHLDSHRHIHTVFPIGRIVVKVARKFGIRYVRPARNLSQRSGVIASTYKWLFNRYIAANTNTARYFGDIEDIVHPQFQAPGSGLIECMVHLDGSPRGLAGQRLLEGEAYRSVLSRYQLVDHANAGY